MADSGPARTIQQQDAGQCRILFECARDMNGKVAAGFEEYNSLKPCPLKPDARSLGNILRASKARTPKFHSKAHSPA